MDTEQEIKIMELQLNSPIANFNLIEKMQYMSEYFDNDQGFSREARDIVRSNIAKNL